MCFVTKILPFSSTHQIFYPQHGEESNFEFSFYFMDFRLLPLFYEEVLVPKPSIWAHSISIPKKQERLSYSSVTNILCHLFIGLCTEPLPLRKNRRRKKGGSVLGSITSRCSAGGIKDRTLETAEIEPRAVHRLSFYIPHKQLNLNITGKNVKFCFVSILFLYY